MVPRPTGQLCSGLVNWEAATAAAHDRRFAEKRRRDPGPEYRESAAMWQDFFMQLVGTVNESLLSAPPGTYWHQYLSFL
jgi:hypothetical protein